MRSELQWFINHITKLSGIHMLKSVEWSPYDRMASTLIAYADASAIGMGIWFPGEYAGFQCLLPVDGPKNLIFFYEALTVCSAVRLGTKYGCDQIAVYSDNMNTVDMFCSLSEKPAYNLILMSSVDFAINNSITFKVYYVPGKQNIITDHLSRFQNTKALQLALKLQICNFQPPWNALGAIKK
jgi:hypothetical protein